MAEDEHVGEEPVEDEAVEDERLQVIDSGSSERFYRAMAEQSLRATKFEHRMRSSRMRQQLTSDAEVIDLTSIEGRAAPLPRD